jgi:hypothetical protein
MRILASRIKRQLEGQVGRWEHCAIYENELQRLWPLDEKNRKAKIAAFAMEYGFRLSVYRPGLCAIFEEGLNDAAPISSTSIQDGKYSGYRIQSTLDRIEIALATAHRWQTIAKLRWEMVAKLLGVLLRRVASQTTMAFSHCYTSLESSLKAKWQRIRHPVPPTISTHVYEIRPRPDHRGVDLVSDSLPYSPLWYRGPNAISNAIKYAKFSSRSHDAVIRVFNEVGKVIETHEQAGDLFKPRTPASASPANTSPVPAKSASAEPATTAPALGGGHSLVWVNTEKHVYHREGSRFYGTTKKGKYVTEREAIQTGNKAARLGSATARSNSIGYARFFRPFTRRRHSRLR